MQKKIRKRYFVFEKPASDSVDLNCSTKKRILVIGSQCANKQS